MIDGRAIRRVTTQRAATLMRLLGGGALYDAVMTHWFMKSWASERCGPRERMKKCLALVVPSHIDRTMRLQIGKWSDPMEYRRLVGAITEKQPLHLLPGIELRGRNYHIDHVMSVNYGFNMNLDPEVVGHISNLRIITRKENFKKADRMVYTNLFNDYR